MKRRGYFAASNSGRSCANAKVINTPESPDFTPIKHKIPSTSPQGHDGNEVIRANVKFESNVQN